MLTKSVKVNNKEITARELTVREIRELLAKEDTPGDDIDMIGDFIMSDMTFSMMAQFSDVKKKDIENMAPSDIEKIGDAIREVNSGFFALAGRWQQIDDLLTKTKS